MVLSSRDCNPSPGQSQNEEVQKAGAQPGLKFTGDLGLVSQCFIGALVTSSMKWNLGYLEWVIVLLPEARTSTELRE